MTRSLGCRVWDENGREYLDFVMALGAVALGYGHPAVSRAAIEAVEQGVVGSLAPVLEEEVAADICRLMPWVERVRFLKTGAEAMAAAVRLARVATGREAVLGCGYHGWLDWCQAGEAAGVPVATRALYGEIPFNDPAATRERIRAAGDRLAAVVMEPVILRPPDPEWLAVVREETDRVGALLMVDEIKTVCRLAVGGGCERYGIRPDLVVVGKAIANGFPLAAVGGRAEVMELVTSHLDLFHARDGDGLARRREGHARGGERGGGAGASHPDGSAAARGVPPPGLPARGDRARGGGHPRDVPPGLSRRADLGTGGDGMRRTRAAAQARRLQLRVAGAR